MDTSAPGVTKNAADAPRMGATSDVAFAMLPCATVQPADLKLAATRVVGSRVTIVMPRQPILVESASMVALPTQPDAPTITILPQSGFSAENMANAGKAWGKGGCGTVGGNSVEWRV